MAAHPDIAAIVLAADGHPDATVDGQPALTHVLGMVAGWELATPTVTVFSRTTEDLLEAIDLGEGVAVIDEDGIDRGSALSVGLDALTHLHPEAVATFVVDGDVPGVPSKVPEALISQLESSGRMAAAPQYRYVRSGPVLVGRQLWDPLMASETEQPLAELLTAHPEWTTTVVISERAPAPAT